VFPVPNVTDISQQSQSKVSQKSAKILQIEKKGKCNKLPAAASLLADVAAPWSLTPVYAPDESLQRRSRGRPASNIKKYTGCNGSFSRNFKQDDNY
jgi:hypothetical protein